MLNSRFQTFKPSEFGLQICKWVFLLLMIFVTLLPIYWIMITSVKAPDELVTIPPVLWPRNPVWLDNYTEVLTRVPIVRYYANSLIVTFSIVIANLFTSSLAGYIFEKFDFPGKNVLFVAIIATMMVPFSVTVIPVYLLVNNLKLLDTLAGLIVPSLVSAFGIFLMRQFNKSVPTELLDAARIDGASEFTIYWRVVVPLTQPALAALAIFTFVYSWDEFFWPRIVIREATKQTLPLSLALFRSENMGPLMWHLTAAAAVMVMLPPLIVFALGQRHIIEGIQLTGIKG